METKHEKYSGLNTFDQEVSLWQLLPVDDGRALKKLKTIVNAAQNGHLNVKNKPLSVLITGQTGKRTCGRAFLRALGATNINEIPSHLLSIRYSGNEYVNSQVHFDGLLLSSVEKLSPTHAYPLFEYLKSGYSTVKNYALLGKTPYPYEKLYGDCPVVLTAGKVNKVPSFVREWVDHVVTIDKCTPRQVEHIILNRIWHCGIDFESETLVKTIAQQGQYSLKKAMMVLNESLTVMNSEGQTVLLSNHIDKAVALL